MTNKLQMLNSKKTNIARRGLEFHVLVFVIYLLFGNCILFIQISQATILTVKQDGSGDYTTMQAGINAASTGDTVLVWPGTYFENIDYNSKSITVASLYLITQDVSYIHSTIIDGNMNGSCVFVQDCTGESATICGFTIQHGSGYSNLKKGGGIYINSCIVEIRNCIIKNNMSRGGGGLFGQNAEIILKGTIIKKNIAIYNSGGILITYNTFLQFDTTELNSVFLNYGPRGSDIAKSEDSYIQKIVLDTGTVIYPDNHFFYSYDMMGYPVNDMSWQIYNSKIDQVNANLYVSPNGDNQNSGLTSFDPLQSLSYAIKKLLPDTNNPKSIFLSPGTYSSSINSEIFPLTPRSYSKFVGASQSNTIIDAENLFPLLNSFLLTNNLEIKKISFINGIDSHELVGGNGGLDFYDNDNIQLEEIQISNTHGRNRSALNDNLSNIVICNVEIYSNSGGNPLVLGNTGQSLVEKKLTNTVITQNEPGETYDHGHGGGVFLYSSYSYPETTQVKFINSLVTENILWFEPGMSNFGVSGIVCIQQTKLDLINTTISNNIVINPVQSAQLLASEGSYVEIYNSIIYGTENYEIFLGTGQPTSYISTVDISNTDVKGGEENIQNWNNIHILNWLDGNIDEDPQWEGGTEPFDYALQPGSPCIDAGVPMYEAGMDYPYIKEENGKYVLYMLDGDTVTLPAYDLAGNPRISGGRIDMGAYEWQDTTTKIPSSKFQKPIRGLHIYPNPFTSNVFVSFSTEREHEILLEVVDMNGQIVRTIAENRFPPGKYRLVWDGTDDAGFAVKTGNYVICLYLDGRLAGCEKIMKSAK